MELLTKLQTPVEIPELDGLIAYQGMTTKKLMFIKKEEYSENVIDDMFKVTPVGRIAHAEFTNTGSIPKSLKPFVI